MNKPYTCHNCGTVFDAYPIVAEDQRGDAMCKQPSKVRVKCPGCYTAGYTEPNQMIYVLDIEADAAHVMEL